MSKKNITRVYVYTALLSLIIVSCSLKDPRTVIHDPTFDPYIEMYVKEKGKKLNYDIPIAFSSSLKEEGPYVVGLCTSWESGYRQVQIDPVYWNSVPENYRISLIFHELGHCDLNKNDSQNPMSIMYYINNGSSNFDELFGRPVRKARSIDTHHYGCHKRIENDWNNVDLEDSL